MKKVIIYTFLTLSIFIALPGCKKYLSLDPPSDLSGNNFWRSQSDAERYTNGLYHLFRGAIYRYNMTAAQNVDAFSFFGWGGDMRGAPVRSNPLRQGGRRLYIDLLADNAIMALPSNANYNYFNGDRFRKWDRFYKLIASSNIAIDKIPKVADNGYSETLRKQHVAEAAFLRNTAYFFLVRLYGDVPYYTDAYYNKPLKRDSMIQVLRNCDLDMEKYKPNLPWSYDDPTLIAVRAMRGSAIILQMHINMWLASFDGSNATQYYNRVDILGKEMQTAEANQAYQLLPLSKTKEIFKGRSKEGLFELPQNTNYGESFGFGAFPDNVLHAPYKNKGVLDSYLSYDPKFMYEIYPEAVADDRKNYWFEPSNMYKGDGTFQMIKFANVFANENAEDFNPDDNQTIFRLPDVYLLHAEALVNLGKIVEALQMVNKVRARANAELFTETNSKKLLDMIFLERAREFMGEGHYWYDAVRTRKITDIDFKFGYKCTLEQFRLGCWTWPIDPSARINNPEITLNEYWQ